MTDFTHRIHGTEMEWGAMKSVRYIPDSLVVVPGTDIAPHVRSALNANHIRYPHALTQNYFLSNGGRFYQDVSERWEYATPEDTSYIGTTANEFASEVLLQDVADNYAENNEGQKISLTKRVIDDISVGCGYHTNYCVDAKKFEIDEDALELFGVYAATRGVLFGSGALLPQGDYLVAQKAATVTIEFASGTTGNTKPVVNLRQQPLADSNRFLRMHDTSSDPSMSPWANRNKLAVASMVLRLIEHGISMPELNFENSIANVSRTVASDPLLKERYKLRNGNSITALGVQRAIVGKVYELSKKVTLNDEEQWALEEWDRAISDLAQNPNLTAKRIEWVARRKILERYKEKHGVSWDSKVLRYKDIQFSEIALNGIAKSLRETLWADYMPDESLISDRVKNPPPKTRASVRAGLISYAQRKGLPLKVDWDFVKIDRKAYYLTDPYDYKSRVN